MLLATLLSSLLLVKVAADDLGYVAFGGHIRWQQSETPVKKFVSNLQVYLFSVDPHSQEEALRQVVSVLPNGAYSVVVSSKGLYRLKLAAPNGWNFIPQNGYHIEIEHANQKHEEYVFHLTGFDVSGQVVTAGMKTGPPGLVVSALKGHLPPSASSSIVCNTRTSTDGSFVLSAIAPGDYLVTVGDLETISGPKDVRIGVKITVSANSLKLNEPLVLQGHILRSKITFTEKGVAHITVVLFILKNSTLSAGDLELFGCSKLSPTASYIVPDILEQLVDLKPICQTTSDSDGSISFSRLAGGEYYLVAYHDPTKTPEFKSKLTILPAFLKASMEHHDLTLGEEFRVTGVHLTGGRVQLASGTPIADAQVYVNGVLMTQSDIAGAYELEISTPGRYTLRVDSGPLPSPNVSVPKFQFSDIVAELSPKTDRLPLFIPSKVEVCAEFLFSTSAEARLQDLPSIEFVSASQRSVKEQASMAADSRSARVCTFLTPEKHTASLTQTSQFVLFSPTIVSVDLTKGPSKELVFTQFQAAVHGEIICAQACQSTSDKDRLAVTLIPFDGRSVKEVSYLTSINQDQKNTAFATYHFDSVFPGTYDVKLVTASSDRAPEWTPANGWCWLGTEKPRQITIVDKDISARDTPALRFEQSGYRVRIETPLLESLFSLPIDFSVTSANGPDKAGSDKSKLKKDKTTHVDLHYILTGPISTICVPMAPDNFILKAHSPCLRLSAPQPATLRPSTDVSVASRQGQVVRLLVSSLPIEVRIEVSSEFASLSKLRLPHLSVEAAVTSAAARKPGKTVQLSPVWEKLVAKAVLWVTPGDFVNLTVIPALDSATVADVHPLLIPSSRVITVPNPLQLTNPSSKALEVRGVSNSLSNVTSDLDCSPVFVRVFDSLSPLFTMRPGFFFTGTIIPPVPKALVSVFAKEGVVTSSASFEGSLDLSEYQPVEDLVGQRLSLVAQTLTTDSGHFKVGPFYFHEQSVSTVVPSSLLSVRIQKPGYEFSEVVSGEGRSEWMFTARKLALIELKVINELNQPLPDTLVTIIGSSYRGSETTGSNGIVRYIGLPPGEYYLQPMLKEYDFVVQSGASLVAAMEHALSVVEGGSVNLELIGNRIAFSAIGQVVSLSGYPEAQVAVEAKLISSLERGSQPVYPEGVQESSVPLCRHVENSGLPVPIEQAVTRFDGEFKLRGLLPGCFYMVSVRVQSGLNGVNQWQRNVAPKRVVVRTVKEDVHGLYFYMLPHVHTEIISAIVDTTDHYLPGLNIVVHPVNKPGSVVIRHKFATESRLFSTGVKHRSLVPGEQYTILLETDHNLSPHGQNLTVQKFNFKLTPGVSQHFNFVYSPHSNYASTGTRV